MVCLWRSAVSCSCRGRGAEVGISQVNNSASLWQPFLYCFTRWQRSCIACRRYNVRQTCVFAVFWLIYLAVKMIALKGFNFSCVLWSAKYLLRKTRQLQTGSTVHRSIARWCIQRNGLIFAVCCGNPGQCVMGMQPKFTQNCRGPLCTLDLVY